MHSPSLSATPDPRRASPEERRRRRSAARCLEGLLLAFLALQAAQGLRRVALDPPGGADIAANQAGSPEPASVDLARDPAWRLALLPGIGPLRAQAIVEDRLRHGPPACPHDLERIHGIGAETVRRLGRGDGLRILLDGRPVGAGRSNTAPGPGVQR